jgi:curved DNA-binding protein CbpA
VRQCHPDKNLGNVTAALAEVKKWNEAYRMITDFIDVSVADEEYYTFVNGDVNNIIDYMNGFGNQVLLSQQNNDQRAEEAAFNAQTIQNAISEKNQQ